MEAIIMNKSFQRIYILDVFESFIWNERYNEIGDFEIYTYANTEYLQNIIKGYYVSLEDSDRLMIIEDIEIESDAENGSKLKFTGRSLESILDRRIVWDQTVLEGSVQNAIKTIINDSIISPTDSERTISNFIFVDSTDSSITGLEIESAQFMGDSVYDVIESMCKLFNLGFKIILDGSSFKFSLYFGTNRSYNQTAVPYVVFAPSYENIINSNYYESTRTEKNVTLVGGEGEGSDKKTVTVYSDSTSHETGLDRKEYYTDASGISSTVDGEEITTEEYEAQLTQKGQEELAQLVATQTFDGEVDTLNSFKVGTDFFIGDIVQLSNEFGVTATSRVIEIIRTQDSNGYSMYPTFEAV